MRVSRRNLLSSAGVIAAGAAMASCSNILGTGVGISVSTGGNVTVTLPANVTAFVQHIVSAAAKYIPTAESIAQQAAALFGPQYATIVAIGSAALNTLITSLETLVSPPVTAPATTTTAAARLGGMRRRFGAPLRAALVGMTQQGVLVYGVPAK